MALHSEHHEVTGAEAPPHVSLDRAVPTAHEAFAKKLLRESGRGSIVENEGARRRSEREDLLTKAVLNAVQEGQFGLGVFVRTGKFSASLGGIDRETGYPVLFVMPSAENEPSKLVGFSMDEVEYTVAHEQRRVVGVVKPKPAIAEALGLFGKAVAESAETVPAGTLAGEFFLTERPAANDQPKERELKAYVRQSGEITEYKLPRELSCLVRPGTSYYFAVDQEANGQTERRRMVKLVPPYVVRDERVDDIAEAVKATRRRATDRNGTFQSSRAANARSAK